MVLHPSVWVLRKQRLGRGWGGGRGQTVNSRPTCLHNGKALPPMKVTVSKATAQSSTRAVKARTLGNARQGASINCIVH